MYYVTLQHGGAFPHEIERLWCTVAANKRNVIPILEFLISRGLQEMNAQVTSACLGAVNKSASLQIVDACTLVYQRLSVARKALCLMLWLAKRLMCLAIACTLRFVP